MKVKKGIIKIAILCAVVTLFSVAIMNHLAELRDLVEIENQLLLSMEREQAIYRQLSSEIESHNSDSFVERIARQQLGFAFPDEYIFIRE